MKRVWFLCLAALVTGMDLVSKTAVFAWLEKVGTGPDGVHWVFGRWFGLTRGMNPAAMGGMGRGVSPTLIAGFIGLAVLGLAISLFHPKVQSGWTLTALALVLGGAVGNLCDRIAWLEVRDFLDVWPRVFRGTWLYHWPTFNLADSAVVAGVAVLVCRSLFAREEEPRPAGKVEDL